MLHQIGLWNAISSDMMIEIIAMCYGHVCSWMKALTFNENALMLVEAAAGGFV